MRDAPILEIVIPAAFSPRESGEGIQCRLTNATGSPLSRGTTPILWNLSRNSVILGK